MIAFKEWLKQKDARLRKLAAIFYPLLLTFLCGGVYLKTMLPGLGYSGDTAKFQFIGKVLGIPHATGYPLYIILNRLFIQLPVGSIAYRANLMSAFFAVLTVLMLYFTIRRLLEREAAAFAAALVFAFTATFWTQALVAEVYTLNSFLVILAIFLLLQWQQTGNNRYYIAFLFSYAISFGNHLTMITIFPALLVFIVITKPNAILAIKNLLAAAAAIAIGAIQYLYFLLRTSQQAAYLEHQVINLQDLFEMVTGLRFQNQMFSFSPLQILTKRLPMFASRHLEELTIWGVVLGLLGMAWLARKKGKVFALLILAYCGEGFFLLNYNIPDISAYFIPLYLIFAVFIAAGVLGLIEIFTAIMPRAGNTVFSGLFQLLLLFLALNMLLINRSSVDMSKEVEDDARLTTLLENIPAESAIATDNYLDKMYVYNKIFLDYPEKSFLNFEINPQSDIRAEVVMSMMRYFNIDPNLAKQVRRRMYLPSLSTWRHFSQQGIKIETEIFRSKKADKAYTFYRVILKEYRFY